jgi:hypothetical protein
VLADPRALAGVVMTSTDALIEAVIRLGARVLGTAAMDDTALELVWDAPRWEAAVLDKDDVEAFRFGHGESPEAALRHLLEALVGEVRHRHPTDGVLIGLGLAALGVR